MSHREEKFKDVSSLGESSEQVEKPNGNDIILEEEEEESDERINDVRKRKTSSLICSESYHHHDGDGDHSRTGGWTLPEKRSQGLEVRSRYVG